MQQRELIDKCTTPDGTPVELYRESGNLMVRIGGEVVMSDREHGSEETLAERACRPLATVSDARVAIGGLGMGYTARAALDAVGENASVTVVELVQGIVDWNRGPLGHLAGHPLNDTRLTLAVTDVVDYVKSGPDPLDVILLDVDNGPEPLASGSGWLYSTDGLRAMRRILRPGGTLGIWSASPSHGFEIRLKRAGFEPEVTRARSRGGLNKGSWHTLYFGHLPGSRS